MTITAYAAVAQVDSIEPFTASPMRLGYSRHLPVVALEEDTVAIIVGRLRALESLCSSRSTPYGSLSPFGSLGCLCSGSVELIKP